MVIILFCHCIDRLTKKSHLFFLSSALDLAEYVQQLLPVLVTLFISDAALNVLCLFLLEAFH